MNRQMHDEILRLRALNTELLEALGHQGSLCGHCGVWHTGNCGHWEIAACALSYECGIGCQLARAAIAKAEEEA